MLARATIAVTPSARAVTPHDPPRQSLRIAVLWPGLSGYVNACLKALAERPEVDILVAHAPPVGDAPFDETQFGWIPRSIRLKSPPDGVDLLARLTAFRPDVVLVVSWHIRAFRYVLRRLNPRPLRVLCMDNQWLGTVKQYLGVVGSRWYLHPLYDAAFVPGERQAAFARRLGFRPHAIWRGLYCPDHDSFASAADGVPRSRSFGYVGRLTEQKGIADLLQAYDLYRARTSDPWELVVAGTGPLSGAVSGHLGVRYAGFLQPSALPSWVAGIGCLVVPSRYEPWGVVIAEAAASGAPIVATDACGAGPHLVHDFVNGRIARTGHPDSLAECLQHVSSASDPERTTMGQFSRNLASVYTPDRWADTVLGSSTGLLRQRGQYGPFAPSYHSAALTVGTKADDDA